MFGLGWTRGGVGGEARSGKGGTSELVDFKLASSSLPGSDPKPQHSHPVMSAPGSPSSSRSSSPPLELDPATLAILGSFLSEKADEEERFRQLAENETGQVNIHMSSRPDRAEY